MTKEQPSFDTIWKMTKEEFRDKQKPNVQRGMKRKLEAAYDAILDKMYKLQQEIDIELFKLNNIDPNQVVNQSLEIQQAQTAIKILEDIYTSLFGKDAVISRE